MSDEKRPSAEVREWVRHQMARHGIRQTQLADLLGITQAAISLKLSEGPKASPFTINEVVALEGAFGESSPVQVTKAAKSNRSSAPTEFRDIGNGNWQLSINRTVTHDIALKIMSLLGPGMNSERA